MWGMPAPERIRLEAAVRRVRRLYPGPAGDMVSREMSAWLDIGTRFGGADLMGRIVDHVLRAPLPRNTLDV